MQIDRQTDQHKQKQIIDRQVYTKKINGQKDTQKDKQKKYIYIQITFNYLEGYTDEKIEAYIDVQIEAYIDEQIEGYIDEYIKGYIDEYTEEYIDEQKDTQMNRRIHR